MKKIFKYILSLSLLLTLTFMYEKETDAATKVIHTGYYIKKQGYLTNSQLKKHVAYVEKTQKQLRTLAKYSSYLGNNNIKANDLPYQLAKFAIKNDTVTKKMKSKAAQGYGMGWTHMYAAGKNTLSVIPRYDFSKSKIVYKK